MSWPDALKKNSLYYISTYFHGLVVRMLDPHAGNPGSNLTNSINCLVFGDFFFFKLALLARTISKSFLKSPGQELSEHMVLSSGKTIFASLDFREVCQSSVTSQLGYQMVGFGSGRLVIPKSRLQRDSSTVNCCYSVVGFHFRVRSVASTSWLCGYVCTRSFTKFLRSRSN